MSHANSGTASGFRPKLHSRAESLSLESLDMRSGKFGRESCMGRESLGIPKFGRESLDIGPNFQPKSRLSRPNSGMSRFLRPMSRILRPNFGMSRLSRPTLRLNSRVSRLNLSARLCNLSLNPKATRSSKSGHETGPQPGQLSCHAFT